MIAEQGAGAPVKGTIQAVTSVFESLGYVLILLDSDFRIVHHCSLLSSTVGLASEALCGTSIDRLLGSELFGTYGIVRRQLEAGERRTSVAATLQHHAGAVSPVVMSAAPLSPAGREWLGNDVAYVVILKSADAAPVQHPAEDAHLAIRGEAAHRDALRAVLDEYHWQRAKAAQALGISRTTLWRKMREAGLI